MIKKVLKWIEIVKNKEVFFQKGIVLCGKQGIYEEIKNIYIIYIIELKIKVYVHVIVEDGKKEKLFDDEQIKHVEISYNVIKVLLIDFSDEEIDKEINNVLLISFLIFMIKHITCLNSF